ncbi:MAG: DUF3416 domain-containing protein [Acidimicrobiia bacterium]|nr:DUF3416 domain-containing protein [Acidimicrobiia bacterium]
MLSPVLVDILRPLTPRGSRPAKTTVGEATPVLALIIKDGHDELGAALGWSGPSGEGGWARMTQGELGRFSGELTPTEVGRHRVVVQAWTDRYAGWRRDVVKRAAAGQDLTVELEVGARHLDHLVQRATSSGSAAGGLRAAAAGLRDGSLTVDARLAAGLRPDAIAAAAALVPDWDLSEAEVALWVDRERAGFSAWYELFPRSYGGFGGVIEELPRLEALGFDVLYLPPIHPIGHTYRKGRNNTLDPEPGDPGSPWAIGSEEGGHDAIHPELGDEADFLELVAAAQRHGMEVALDYALQCSPDHPWVRQHPEWFTRLPDGSIRYAENPPKKYQDIYPIDFWPEDTADRRALWTACREVLVHWVDLGVRIFRVDNPHTKPFAFWEWLIASVQEEHPDVIFLAEAFTDPPRMLALGEIGFTQSYTYFTWRHSRWELEQYLGELASAPSVDTMRPNFWPNTPDILEGVLRDGPLGAFALRFVLASTLTPNYGIFSGFELGENLPASADNTEYWDSEKYQVVKRDYGAQPNLSPLISAVNASRRRHPALRTLRTLRFHGCDNDQLLVYSKTSEGTGTAGGRDIVLVVVNLDPRSPQAGTLDLEIGALGLGDGAPYTAHDELTDTAYSWTGRHPWVYLNPAVGQPAHLLHLRPG